MKTRYAAAASIALGLIWSLILASIVSESFIPVKLGIIIDSIIVVLLIFLFIGYKDALDDMPRLKKFAMIALISLCISQASRYMYLYEYIGYSLNLPNLGSHFPFAINAILSIPPIIFGVMLFRKRNELKTNFLPITFLVWAVTLSLRPLNYLLYISDSLFEIFGYDFSYFALLTPIVARLVLSIAEAKFFYKKDNVNNFFGTASLVCGIISFFYNPVFIVSIYTIIFGNIQRKEKNNSYAFAGLILGYLTLIYKVILIFAGAYILRFML